MADEAKVDTQETTATEVETAPEVQEVETPEVKTVEIKTAGEIMETKGKAPETVGLDKFLDVKKDNKQLRADIADLKKLIESGATKSEVSHDIQAIAEEYGVDAGFLNKFTAAVKAEASKEAEEKLRPLQEKERDAAIDKVFTEHFGKAMETMPEYKDVVNPSVIKTLSLQPSNANKTFAQLIEETYGNAISGKRTIESTVPGGGKEPESLDYERAAKDMDYFKSVMASPKLKAEYNARMLEKGF